MIVDIPDTTISRVSKRLVQMRESGGAVALGRVLTLVIQTDLAGLEAAVKAANEASHEHPCRVIVLADDNDTIALSEDRLDAQVRIGGDAGASEVIVLRAYGRVGDDPESLVTGLLLPDAPVVSWWPGDCPNNVAATQIGAMSSRRLTDSAASLDPNAKLRQLAEHYSPGDSDFAWTRLTLWRAQLAAILDQPPFDPVLSVSVEGVDANPSIALLAAWLRLKLAVPVTVTQKPNERQTTGISRVTFSRGNGDITLQRVSPAKASIDIPGQPLREIALPMRTLRDCLSEDMRRLDADVVYGQVLATLREVQVG